MGKRRGLSAEKRAAIVALHKAGHTMRQIAKQEHVSLGSVHYTVKRHSKMVDMNEIRVLRAVVLREQGWTYRQIAADLKFLCVRIYRAIKRHRETGLYKRRQGQATPPLRVSMTTEN
ncbi:hypothetical protein C0J52_26414 [Blattella germanica]|nr:hypothetical protein C0J52_26414 [Blattella germanica]